MKLNNKGMTAVEVLICFSIVSIISVGMLKLATGFKDKQEIESYKTTVLTFKNTVTKAIASDIIENDGVKSVVIDNNDQTDNTDTYTVSATITLNKNDASRSLEIIQCSGDNCGDNSSKIIYNDKTYNVPKVPRLNFNESDIREYEGFLIIQVGFKHPDLGNQFDAIRIKFPLSSSYENIY